MTPAANESQRPEDSEDRGVSETPVASQTSPHAPGSPSAIEVAPPTTSTTDTPYLGRPKKKLRQGRPPNPKLHLDPKYFQVNPDGDDYIQIDFDEAGEKKVLSTGHLLDGREYRVRPFTITGRGEKLFVLATEVARLLGYRDSYLFFNKNKRLFKLTATDMEKEDLIRRNLIAMSFRARQTSVVTCRSMFINFGARIVLDGRRVRDDYWETIARKEGVAEELVDDSGGQYAPPIPLVAPTVTPAINMSTEDRIREFQTTPKAPASVMGPAYSGDVEPVSVIALADHVRAAIEFNKQLARERKERELRWWQAWSSMQTDEEEEQPVSVKEEKKDGIDERASMPPPGSEYRVDQSVEPL